jgi:hypothetical protein
MGAPGRERSIVTSTPGASVFCAAAEPASMSARKAAPANFFILPPPPVPGRFYSDKIGSRKRRKNKTPVLNLYS